MDNASPNREIDRYSDLKKFLGKVIRRWHWFVISIGWALLIAFLVIRYQKPIYSVNASLITKKFEENNNSFLPALLNDDIFRLRTEIYQEIPLLKSNNRISETLKRLDFGVSYFLEGNIKTSEIYPDFQYKVVIDSSSSFFPYSIPIYIEELNPGEYRLSSSSPIIKNQFDDRKLRFNEKVSGKGFSFKIVKTDKPLVKEEYRYFFIINNPDQLIAQYRGKLNIAWQQQGSAILNVNIQSPIPEKDLDFIKRYFEVVIETGLEEKNAQASNTIRFIDEQLEQLGDSLFGYLVDMDNYKLENRDLIFGSSYIFQRLNSLDSLKASYQLTNQYFDYLEKYINQKRGDQIFAPNLIGLNAPLLDELVKNYITLKMNNQPDINDGNNLNPLVVRDDDKLSKLELDIFENIRNMRRDNLSYIRQIDEKINFYLNSISDVQKEFRGLTRIEKKSELNENLYNILLEKRTEASIAKASATSDYQVVEYPFYSNQEIYPDRARFYIIAFLIGLGLPISLIYISDILNNKIISRDDLDRNTSIPVIGHIGHSILKTNLVVKENPKSLISEAFRTIRANLQYYIGTQDKKCNIFMVSSSISDEGKTFSAINLAYIFALSGKKTLLLGGDLRRPSLAGYVGMKEHPGLSNFLAGLVSKQDIMLSYELDNLKLILAGDIPPNPSELLASDKMASFIEELKLEFDYIIIDTPPIGMVSDAFELLKYSDFNILVVRQGKTIKSALTSINGLYESGKIKHIGILFNDVDFRKLEYGYGYGYGYSNRYGYYYGYGYGYGEGYFDEEKKDKGGIFKRIRSQYNNGKKNG